MLAMLQVAMNGNSMLRNGLMNPDYLEEECIFLIPRKK